MAETIFASEQIEELADSKLVGIFGFVYAKFPWFPENLFVGDGPRHTGNGDSEQNQVYDLM